MLLNFSQVISDCQVFRCL